jgi:hypothetical protein
LKTGNPAEETLTSLEAALSLSGASPRTSLTKKEKPDLGTMMMENWRRLTILEFNLKNLLLADSRV